MNPLLVGIQVNAQAQGSLDALVSLRIDLAALYLERNLEVADADSVYGDIPVVLSRLYIFNGFFLPISFSKYFSSFFDRVTAVIKGGFFSGRGRIPQEETFATTGTTARSFSEVWDCPRAVSRPYAFSSQSSFSKPP